jgi:hypothetical protein
MKIMLPGLPQLCPAEDLGLVPVAVQVFLPKLGGTLRYLPSLIEPEVSNFIKSVDRGDMPGTNVAPIGNAG